MGVGAVVSPSAQVHNAKCSVRVAWLRSTSIPSHFSQEARTVESRSCLRRMPRDMKLVRQRAAEGEKRRICNGAKVRNDDHSTIHEIAIVIDGHQPVITHATPASDRSIAGRKRQVARVHRGYQSAGLCCRVQKNTSCHIHSAKATPPDACSKNVCLFRLWTPKAPETFLRICHCFFLMVIHMSRARLGTERASKPTTKTERWPMCVAEE